jgi:AhpD family alkylhydroperoxidase
VKASLDKVPNLFATLANAPSALDGFLSLSKVLSRGRLSARQREILALATAHENECEYCLAAHTEAAKAVGVSAAEILKAREGNSDDSFKRSLTRFARNTLRQRGLVSDEDLDIARKVGSTTASCWKSLPTSHSTL